MARMIEDQRKNLVGSKIRALRMARGYSQKQLSEKLEILAIYICRGSICRIEEHKRTVTDIELKGFTQIFGVTIDELFEE